MKSKILCIIPARGGSKGVPGKNIKLLKGKPLIQYSFEFAKAINIFSTVCISTDSEQIAEVASKIGLEVPFIRPSVLATDEASSFGLIRHAIEFYEAEKKIFFDYVCLLQPTVPFRDIDAIKPRIIEFISSEGYDTLISVRLIPHQYNPEWAFQYDSVSNNLKPNNHEGLQKRRQNLQNFYYRDGSIYFFRAHNIKFLNSIYGANIMPLILTDENEINIDTMYDWQRAENFIINSGTI